MMGHSSQIHKLNTHGYNSLGEYNVGYTYLSARGSPSINPVFQHIFTGIGEDGGNVDVFLTNDIAPGSYDITLGTNPNGSGIWLPEEIADAWVATHGTPAVGITTTSIGGGLVEWDCSGSGLGWMYVNDVVYTAP